MAHDFLASITLAELDIDAIRDRAERPSRLVRGDEGFMSARANADHFDQAVKDSQADIAPLLEALDVLVADRDMILRGSRCPQCSATEWNGASHERNKNADMVETLEAHLAAEHHVEYDSAGDEAYGNNKRCSCGKGVFPCDERKALEAVIATNKAKG